MRPFAVLLGAIALALLGHAVPAREPPPPPADQTTQAPTDPVALGRVPGWPLWVEAGRGGSASVLSADGTLLWVRSGAPDTPLRIASGVAGEQLAACGPALLAVDDRGALRRLPRAPEFPVASVAGPAASRYHRPVCTPDGDVLALDPLGAVLLLSRDLTPLARAPIAALPDAELVLVDLDGVPAVAVLSAPTQRYRHGTLGDEVEAGALTLLRLPDLQTLATWRPAWPGVIEERRVTPWHAQGVTGLYVTVADDEDGARLVSLVWDGETLSTLAEGAPLGASQRWLHLIGVGDDRAYAVHDPRDDGTFVRYRVPAGAVGLARTLGEPLALHAAAYPFVLESHLDGERLLDRALSLGPLEDGGDLLLAPHVDQRTLLWLRCDDRTCERLESVRLPARLATNLSPGPPQGPVSEVVLADRAGTVWSLPLPLRMAGGETEVGPGQR